MTDSMGNENGIHNRSGIADMNRCELQGLLERTFEHYRRQREDREYEEWLDDARRDGTLNHHRLNADIEMELDDFERKAGS